MIPYLLFVHFTLLIPAYVVVKKSKLFLKNPGLELCLSYFASLVFFAAMTALGYVVNIPQIALQVIHWSVIGVTLFYLIKDKIYFELLAHKFILGLVLLMSFFSYAFIGLQFSGPQKFIPDPEVMKDRNYQVLSVKVLNVAQTNANDNYVPYRQAQFFVNQSDVAKDSFIDEWGVHFFQRTPLLGAVTAEYFTLLNDQPPIDYTWSTTSQDPERTYLKFQIIAQILNSLLIIPGFFLLRKLFDLRSAALAVLFIVPSQFFLFNSFFTWPKSLVAFCILLSWMLILEKGRSCLVLAAATSGVAFLVHDLAVLYIGASFLLLLHHRRIRDAFLFSAIAALVALPWILVSVLKFQKPSNFILYPFSLHDIPQPHNKDKVMEEFFRTSPFDILTIKLHSLVYLLTPYQLFITESGQPPARRFWALGVFSIPGAIGMGLFVGTLMGAIKKRDFTFWILALVPIILSVMVIGWAKGLGALHFAEASVVLFVGLGAWALVSLQRKIWLLVVYAINAGQLVFFILYSYNFQFAPWTSSIADITRLAIMAATVVLCGWLIHKISHQNPRRPNSFLPTKDYLG